MCHPGAIPSPSISQARNEIPSKLPARSSSPILQTDAASCCRIDDNRQRPECSRRSHRRSTELHLVHTPYHLWQFLLNNGGTFDMRTGTGTNVSLQYHLCGNEHSRPSNGNCPDGDVFNDNERIQCDHFREVGWARRCFSNPTSMAYGEHGSPDRCSLSRAASWRPVDDTHDLSRNKQQLHCGVRHPVYV